MYPSSTDREAPRFLEDIRVQDLVRTWAMARANPLKYRNRDMVQVMVAMVLVVLRKQGNLPSMIYSVEVREVPPRRTVREQVAEP
jgi:hypothetical protein